MLGAKGYAVDRAVAILRDKWSVSKAIVEAGGDLYALGRPEDAAGWTIGIGHPTSETANCATMELADRAVATSGIRESRELFDPFTGEAVESYLSMTTCAATTMDADAASTTLFVAGRDRRPRIGSVDYLCLSQGQAGGLDFETSRDFPAVRRV